MGCKETVRSRSKDRPEVLLLNVWLCVMQQNAMGTSCMILCVSLSSDDTWDMIDGKAIRLRHLRMWKQSSNGDDLLRRR